MESIRLQEAAEAELGSGRHRTFVLEKAVQFGFHETCSCHVRVSEDRRSAEKKDPAQCYAHGVAYGERPFRGTAEFEVEIASHGTGWSGTLKLGVMRLKDARKFVSGDEIPRYSPEGSEHCVWSADRIHNRLAPAGKGASTERAYGLVNLDELRAGDRVGLRLSHDGTLSFFVNGESQGVAADGVYRKGYCVYPVVDHYANCKATRITRAGTARPSWPLQRHTCLGVWPTTPFLTKEPDSQFV